MVHGIFTLLICGEKQIGFETQFECIFYLHLFTSDYLPKLLDLLFLAF
jgi:hypothetical protein